MNSSGNGDSRTGVSRVSRHIGFGTVQQLVDLVDIGHVGRCSYQAVHQSRRCVDANVALHPEVPLIAFLGLMHLRIALIFSVLHPGRRGNLSGIKDSAFLEQ